MERSVKDKNLNIRVSNLTLKLARDKAQTCGISQSKLIRIAIEIVGEDDIFQYMLDKTVK